MFVNVGKYLRTKQIAPHFGDLGKRPHSRWSTQIGLVKSNNTQTAQWTHKNNQTQCSAKADVFWLGTEDLSNLNRNYLSEHIVAT